MKKQLIFIILILLLLFFATVVSCALIPGDASKEEGVYWFPFVLAKSLFPHSPANMGKLILDAPAGKHGFVTNKDGAFYFEDGTPAKFWGTNLCFSACFPSRKEAVITADRLAFFGFNAVRLHHMDYYFEPRGIFKDIVPAHQDPQMKKTGTLSKKQLDKLDYLIYQLKKRGIYIDINLLVSRHFTKADGVIDADTLGTAVRPASIFDPKLVELQKEYAKDLLTHYNPYTKLCYYDDPAIALIEITNENSIFALNKLSIPDYYQTQLENRWRGWAKGRYRTIEEAKKAFYIDIESGYFKKMIDFLKKECGIKVPITGIGGYRQAEDVEAQNDSNFIDAHVYWDHPRFPNVPWDRDNFRIHNKSMLLDKNSGIIGKILKRTPSPRTKPYTITEWNHCYPNQYAYETPALIALYAVKNNWDALFQFSFSHGRETHPQDNNIQTYFDIIANPQILILCSVGSFIFHKTDGPEIIVENGTFKIDSPKIKGAAGFIKDEPIVLDSLTLTTNRDGAVFLYSLKNGPFKKSNKLILITLSEIKNKDSGWNDRERFDWGSAPTMLKKIGVDVVIENTNKLRVYQLNNKGGRDKEIPVRYEDNKISFSTKEATSLWFEIVSG